MKEKNEIKGEVKKEIKRKTLKKKLKSSFALIMSAIVLGTGLLGCDGTAGLSDSSAGAVSVYAVAEAEYPEMAPYPNESEFIKPNGEFDDEGFSEVFDAWRDDIKAQKREEGYADGLEHFFLAGSKQFLSGANDENKIYSPLNVYMALGMLAELTDGESRSQILGVLGSDSIEKLRSQASDVWNAAYRKDGAVTSVLASSVWMNEDYNIKKPALEKLAETYYASSYQGDMESAEFSQALQEWLNQQTGGLLEEQASQITFTPDTILALATTVYFQCKWNSEFNESRTQPGTFRGKAGDVTVDFMHQGDTGTYYWAKQFGAVSRYLENGGRMWFILPDEGVDVEMLLDDEQVMQLVLNANEWDDQKTLIINQSIPKFDAVSQMDIRDGLKGLGITDIFDQALSDFTPMTDDRNDIFLSQAQHDVRVAIDEEGVTAAAYTVMMTAGAGMPPEDEMDFVVDRPFLFVITSDDELPLFMGIVNQP